MLIIPQASGKQYKPRSRENQKKKKKKKRGVQCILANTGSWKFGGGYLKMNYIVR